MADPGSATLTHVEQRLLHLLTPSALVTTNTVRELNKIHRITTEAYLRRAIGSLLRKAVLVQVKKGLYFVTKDGEYDRFLLGQHLFRGYLGFSTALWLWGLKTEEPYDCYVVIPKSKGKRLIKGFHYQSVALGRRAVGSIYLKGYRLSSRAKTFFDCLLMPKYAGGIPRIISALALAKFTDGEWREWLGYVERIGTKSLAQRAGYVLSAAKRDGTIDAPGLIINALGEISKNGTITVLDPSRPRGGRFVKEWNLYDNTERG